MYKDLPVEAICLEYMILNLTLNSEFKFHF